ncbi:MAG: HPF/RaiA family ribosome-associated protein [Spirochaetaceae bacterium]|jgi:putative sigma-54 modulation protein|nr:HPF/RaiA family ribosome-associated protein [Spirochaetaceae bacterium]
MTPAITAVGFNLEEDQSELINKKLERIKYAEDLIVDLTLRIKEDKKYVFDCTVNFRWGAAAHVTESNYDFAKGVNKLIDTLDQKVNKEKEKVQEKKAPPVLPAG